MNFVMGLIAPKSIKLSIFLKITVHKHVGHSTHHFLYASRLCGIIIGQFNDLF